MTNDLTAATMMNTDGSEHHKYTQMLFCSSDNFLYFQRQNLYRADKNKYRKKR